MSVALDRFPPLYQESLRHMNTCRDCSQVIPEGHKYCPACTELNWSEEIAGMKVDQFAVKLADVFDGELRDFEILDGRVEFTYYSKSQERLDLGKRMLDAYGAYCLTGQDSITFALTAKSRGYGAVEMDLA